MTLRPWLVLEHVSKMLEHISKVAAGTSGPHGLRIWARAKFAIHRVLQRLAQPRRGGIWKRIHPPLFLRCALGSLLLLVGGCIELPDFPPAYLVERPRILAIIADPPEFAPGETVQFSVLVTTEEVQRVQWRLCPGFYSQGPSQYDEGIDDEGCAGQLSWPLPDGQRTTLPGELSQQLQVAEISDLPQAVLGVPLSPEVLSRVVQEVGFPLQVEVRVQVGDKTLVGLKRVLVSERVGENSNPPAPHLQIGEVEVVAEQGFRCVASTGEPILLPPASSAEMMPLFAGDEEPWTEPYLVLDAKGQIAERVETPFYTYFTTAGKLSSRTTRAPLRNNVFTMPQSGCARLWVVQQDGHAGASACYFDVWSEDEPQPTAPCLTAAPVD